MYTTDTFHFCAHNFLHEERENFKFARIAQQSIILRCVRDSRAGLEHFCGVILNTSNSIPVLHSNVTLGCRDASSSVSCGRCFRRIHTESLHWTPPWHMALLVAIGTPEFRLFRFTFSTRVLGPLRRRHRCVSSSSVASSFVFHCFLITIISLVLCLLLILSIRNIINIILNIIISLFLHV